jgi:hypothetical protein
VGCFRRGASALPVFLFLPDLLAGVRGFADVFFAEVPEAARRVARRKDFLRLFLDIRLPFVAFRRSIIAVLRLAGIMRTAGRADPRKVCLREVRYATRLLLGAVSARVTSEGSRA